MKQCLEGTSQPSLCSNELYLIRLRVVGVTEAVGDEERDNCGEVVPIAMREAGDAPSGAEMSRLISSLLRREAEMEKNNT